MIKQQESQSQFPLQMKYVCVMPTGKVIYRESNLRIILSATHNATVTLQHIVIDAKNAARGLKASTEIVVDQLKNYRCRPHTYAKNENSSPNHLFLTSPPCIA